MKKNGNLNLIAILWNKVCEDFRTYSVSGEMKTENKLKKLELLKKVFPISKMNLMKTLTENIESESLGVFGRKWESPKWVFDLRGVDSLKLFFALVNSFQGEDDYKDHCFNSLINDFAYKLKTEKVFQKLRELLEQAKKEIDYENKKLIK